MTGYIMLPVFTVKQGKDGEFELTCNDFWAWVFETFFAPFWDGKVYVRYPRKDNT